MAENFYIRCLEFQVPSLHLWFARAETFLAWRIKRIYLSSKNLNPFWEQQSISDYWRPRILIALLQPWYSYNFLITPSASAWDSLRFFGPAKFLQHPHPFIFEKSSVFSNWGKIKGRQYSECVQNIKSSEFCLRLDWFVAKNRDGIRMECCQKGGHYPSLVVSAALTTALNYPIITIPLPLN